MKSFSHLLTIYFSELLFSDRIFHSIYVTHGGTTLKVVTVIFIFRITREFRALVDIYYQILKSFKHTSSFAFQTLVIFPLHQKAMLKRFNHKLYTICKF